MNHGDLYSIVLCFSINPFFKKIIVKDFNNESAYTLFQVSNLIGNSIYLYLNHGNIYLQNFTAKHTKNLVISSSLTMIGSYKLNKLIKTNDISNLTTKIQILTIITSYLIDYKNLINLSYREYFGIIFMISGVVLTKYK